MARAEKLPKGFWRSPSGSLRVQLRVKGHKMESRSFPLFAETPFERRRQREEAEAWALDTRCRMRGGTHVSTRDAAKLTLADALKRYERDKLDPDNSNHRKDINRIKAMLSDAIAQRSVASLRPTDVAAYRDDLVRRGWMASVAAALKRAEGQGASKSRLGEIAGLERLRSLAEAEERSLERRALAKRREAIEAREGIASPARTTVSNKTQLITRALGYLAETVDGVPDLSGTPMPSATPGRERRLRVGEEKMILARARSVNSYLELGIRLAIDTTLRRERVLELSSRHLVDIGGSRSVIMFPREGGRRRKRVGIVPVTPEIRAMLQEAAVLSGYSSIAECDPDVPFLSINGNTFDHHWRDVVLACGIEDLHFHDLRHEGTSRLFERDLTTAEVMSVTGHSTQEMVDRYSHYSAAIVHDKLVDGADVLRLADEIAFLARQFVTAGGDMAVLRSTLGLEDSTLVTAGAAAALR